MKNKIIFTLFLLLTLPGHILALENNIFISCDKTILMNNMETECQIQANNLTFITTSVSGKIIVSDNLEVLSSNYDKKMWTILDNKFDVSNINLISENKNNKDTFTIATFKVRAINTVDSTEKIKFIDVELGDEKYESHNIEVKILSMDVKYDKKNENVNKNTTTRDINIIITVIGIILLLGVCLILYAKRKNK